METTINNTRLKKQSIGMTFSHYEFDLDLLNDQGKINPIPVKYAEPMCDILTKFNVLRFMNWQKTNVNPIWKVGLKPEFHVPPINLDKFLEWEDNDDWRHPPAPKSSLEGKWSESTGVPLRICLRVAKETNSHPWICIPHGRSQEEFEELMHEIVDTTLRALVGTGLTPIFEYSNEVWNGGRFEQQIEIANHRLGRWTTFRHKLPDDVLYKITHNKPLNEWELAEKRKNDHAKGESRAAALAHQIHCTNLIKAHVGKRGLVVIGAQCNDPTVAEALLFNPEVALSPDVDALAIAPYYGPMRQVVSSWSLAEILPRGFHPLIDLENESWIMPDSADAVQRLYHNIRNYILGTKDRQGRSIGGEIRSAFEAHRKLVDRLNDSVQRKHPLHLFAYEGGLDLHYQPPFFKQRNDGLLKLSNEFAQTMTQEKVFALYHKFHHSWEAGQLVKDTLNLWHADQVRGDLFVGYSSATQYKKFGNVNSGDFFGYIDLVDVPGSGNNDQYVATHKLGMLLGRAK